MKLLLELGSRGHAALAFDSEREEVRLNPALESVLGAETCKRWRKTVDELLGRSSIRATDVMDAFGMLATIRSRALGNLPASSVEIAPYQDELDCAAVLFHVTFMGQAIGEDLRQLKTLSPAGTGLETALRLKTADETTHETPPGELQRYFTVASDPSQEAAVIQARQSPGLLVEGRLEPARARPSSTWSPTPSAASAACLSSARSMRRSRWCTNAWSPRALANASSCSMT